MTLREQRLLEERDAALCRAERAEEQNVRFSVAGIVVSFANVILIWLLACALTGCALDAAPVPVVTPAPGMQRFVDVAAARWRAVGCEINAELDGIAVDQIAEVAWPYPTQWLGVTTPQGVHVVADLDDERKTDVMTHELGHVLGLPHSNHGVMLATPAGELPTEDDCNAARDLTR